MRRRKLYRSIMINPRRIDLHPQDRPVDPQEAYERGIQQGMQIASMQQMNHAIAIVNQQASRIAQAQREAFDRGYRAAAKLGKSTETNKEGSYTYADLEAARARGYESGRKSAPASDESSIRKKIVDQMIEECRVISESNPNMKPGVNAVKHRIKKL